MPRRRDAHNNLRAAALSICLLYNPASSSGAEPESHPVFDVHFAVITKNTNAHGVATLNQLKAEVDILNQYFVTEDRRPIVKFRFKSAALYNEIKDSTCELPAHANNPVPFNFLHWAALFNACDDPKVRDPHAINFYVYDGYTAAAGFSDTTSRGMRNSNLPFIVIDWERLNHKDQSVEEHEMGHAFGLGHECVPGARRNTSTNIMASAECGKGSGGKRDIGFNDSQVRTILHYARLIRARLEKP